MTPAEWVDVLDLIHDLWPSRKPWPDKSADRCYRQLRTFRVETVEAAIQRHVGKHPPSPASLEAAVSEVAAYEYRYSENALPEPPRDVDAVDSAIREIRGDGSWSQWLERQA